MISTLLAALLIAELPAAELLEPSWIPRGPGIPGPRSIRPSGAHLLERVEAACVAQRRTELVGFLDLGSADLQGRTPTEIAAVRAGAWASLAVVGVPAELLPRLIGELETTMDPSTFAGAARAAASLGARASAAGPHLMRPFTGDLHEGLVELPACGGARVKTNLRLEAERAIAAIGDHASVREPIAAPIERVPLKAIDLERWRGRPFAIAFFFSRCHNARKCSTTVAAMGRLQRALAGRASLALITLEPAEDTPETLARYAAARGFAIDEHNVVLAPEQRVLDALLTELNAAVSRSAGWVVDHELELHLFDRSGRRAAVLRGADWTTDQAFATLTALP